jgi:hypothetical protein
MKISDLMYGILLALLLVIAAALLMLGALVLMP